MDSIAEPAASSNYIANELYDNVVGWSDYFLRFCLGRPFLQSADFVLDAECGPLPCRLAPFELLALRTLHLTSIEYMRFRRCGLSSIMFKNE